MKDKQAHKIRLHGVKNITISGEYIKLDSLLKYASLVSSGGEAKILIKEGNIFVNGEVCLNRGKKVRSGDLVRFGKDILRVCI